MHEWEHVQYIYIFSLSFFSFFLSFFLSFILGKVRKFASSIAEDEKLIAKFKKDEEDKLQVRVNIQQHVL